MIGIKPMVWLAALLRQAHLVKRVVIDFRAKYFLEIRW